jgi:hypothetical protein
MATINVVQWAGKAHILGLELDLESGFIKAENVTVTTAQKYVLEADTRLVEVVAVSGGAYVRSGNSGSTDIVVGGGSIVDSSIGLPSKHVKIEELDRASGAARLLMLEMA